jgi:hypothetical protein
VGRTDAIDPKQTVLVYLLRTILVATGIMTMRTFVAAWSAVRAAAVCLILCIACTSADACMPSSERGILFEHLPTDMDAPVIIKATIYAARSVVGDADGRQIILMNARVEQVIKGPIEAKELKVFVYLGDCTRAGVGHGIILGTLQDDPRHGLMLQALGDFKQRQYSKSPRP